MSGIWFEGQCSCPPQMEKTMKCGWEKFRVESVAERRRTTVNQENTEKIEVKMRMNEDEVQGRRTNQSIVVDQFIGRRLFLHLSININSSSFTEKLKEQPLDRKLLQKSLF